MHLLDRLWTYVCNKAAFKVLEVATVNKTLFLAADGSSKFVNVLIDI